MHEVHLAVPLVLHMHPQQQVVIAIWILQGEQGSRRHAQIRPCCKHEHAARGSDGWLNSSFEPSHRHESRVMSVKQHSLPATAWPAALPAGAQTGANSAPPQDPGMAETAACLLVARQGRLAAAARHLHCPDLPSRLPGGCHQGCLAGCCEPARAYTCAPGWQRPQQRLPPALIRTDRRQQRQRRPRPEAAALHTEGQSCNHVKITQPLATHAAACWLKLAGAVNLRSSINGQHAGCRLDSAQRKQAHWLLAGHAALGTHLASLPGTLATPPRSEGRARSSRARSPAPHQTAGNDRQARHRGSGTIHACAKPV